jgi:hypothetical protein
MLLSPSDLPNHTWIHLALSYYKEGRAVTFAKQIVRQEIKTGRLVFVSWTIFMDKFILIFCPENKA